MTDDGGARSPRDAGSGGAVRAARILLLAMALLVPAPISADDYPHPDVWLLFEDVGFRPAR